MAECFTTGKPVFEMIPFRSEDPDFIDRLIEENPDFRRLLEARKEAARTGKVSSLQDVRRRLEQQPLVDESTPR